MSPGLSTRHQPTTIQTWAGTAIPPTKRLSGGRSPTLGRGSLGTIEALEVGLGVRVPAELRALWRLTAGDDGVDGGGCLPGNMALMPFEEAEVFYRQQLRHHAGLDALEVRRLEDSGVTVWKPWWIPVISNGPADRTSGLYLDTESGFLGLWSRYNDTYLDERDTLVTYRDPEPAEGVTPCARCTAEPPGVFAERVLLATADSSVQVRRSRRSTYSDGRQIARTNEFVMTKYVRLTRPRPRRADARLAQRCRRGQAARGCQGCPAASGPSWRRGLAIPPAPCFALRHLGPILVANPSGVGPEGMAGLPTCHTGEGRHPCASLRSRHDADRRGACQRDRRGVRPYTTHASKRSRRHGR